MQDFSRVVSTKRQRRKNLGGSGGMLPRKNLKSGRPETPFPAIFYVFCGKLGLNISSVIQVSQN